MEGGVSFFTSSNAGEVIESFLFENLGFRNKKKRQAENEGERSSSTKTTWYRI